MAQSVERMANVAIALAALALAGSLVRREYSSERPPMLESAPPPPMFLSEWLALDSVGVPLDTASGPLHVYIFSDLEGPFCALFHKKVIPSVYRQFANDVTVRLIHLPLRSHKFSRRAAEALECAAVQKRAAAFLDRAYAKQDSIGLVSWTRFALDAGVPDSLAFERCLLSPPIERIAAGETLSVQLDIRSTPTIIVNGWRFAGIQDSAAFLASLKLIKSGVSPVVSLTSP